MGLFAPITYWRSELDWGAGDIDVLLKVAEFFKENIFHSFLPGIEFSYI
jgi:hypothetical protein